MSVAKKQQSGGKKTTKHPGGRPTLYNAGMIDQAIAYIEDCPDFVPSLVGLAMELDVCESTLKKWKALNTKDLDEDNYPRFGEFLHILGKLHDFQKKSALNGGAKGEWNSTIAKLILGKHGYTEKTETKIDGSEALLTTLGVINGKSKGQLPSDDARDSSGTP